MAANQFGLFQDVDVVEVAESWKITFTQQEGLNGTRVFVKDLDCDGTTRLAASGGTNVVKLPKIGDAFEKPAAHATTTVLPYTDPIFATVRLRTIDVDLLLDNPRKIRYTCNYATKSGDEGDFEDDELGVDDLQKSLVVGIAWETADIDKLGEGKDANGNKTINPDLGNLRNNLVWANKFVGMTADGTNVNVENQPVSDTDVDVIRWYLNGTITLTKIYSDWADITERIAKTAMSVNSQVFFKFPPQTVRFEGGNLDQFYDGKGRKRWRGTLNFSIKYIWAAIHPEAVLKGGVGGWNHQLRPDGFWDYHKMRYKNWNIGDNGAVISKEGVVYYYPSKNHETALLLGKNVEEE